MGDLNYGVTKCPFSDKKYVPGVCKRYNGNRLRRFIDASELCLVNTMS